MVLSRRTLLWLVPLLVTLHNLEEALFMPAFLEARNAAIPAFLRDVLPAITYRQFLISLLAVTIIPYLIASFSNLEKDRGPGVYLLLAVQVVMLINVLAHVFMATLLRGYAPGVVTVLINLPFSLYLLHRAWREKWATVRIMILLFPIALIIHTLGIPGFNDSLRTSLSPDPHKSVNQAFACITTYLFYFAPLLPLRLCVSTACR